MRGKKKNQKEQPAEANAWERDAPEQTAEQYDEWRRSVDEREAEAGKYPPLEDVDLDRGLDDEKFNNNGFVVTRKEAREYREAMASYERMRQRRKYTFEEVVASIPPEQRAEHLRNWKPGQPLPEGCRPKTK